MRDILKSSLWGFALLISLCYLIAMAALTYIRSEDCILNPVKIEAIISKANPIVSNLASRFPGEEDKTDKYMYDLHPESKKANDKINLRNL